MFVFWFKEYVQGDQWIDEKFYIIEIVEKKFQFDRLYYIYFDFYVEIKGLQMYCVQLFIDWMCEVFVVQQYFCVSVDFIFGNNNKIDGGRLDVWLLQMSVVRINCMDCLDRMNVVQFMFVWWMLDRMFIDFGLLVRGSRFVDEDVVFELMF